MKLFHSSQRKKPPRHGENLSWGVVPTQFSIWDFHRGARLKIDVLFLKFAVLNFLHELATTGIKERLCYIPRIFQQLFTLWPFPSSTYIYRKIGSKAAKKPLLFVQKGSVVCSRRCQKQSTRALGGCDNWLHGSPLDSNALREAREMLPEEIWIVRRREARLTMKYSGGLQDDQSTLLPNKGTQLTLEARLRQPCPETFTAPLGKAATIGVYWNLALICPAANFSLQGIIYSWTEKHIVDFMFLIRIKKFISVLVCVV